MKYSNYLENMTVSDLYWRVQLACMKVQAHTFLELWLEYYQDQAPLMNENL